MFRFLFLVLFATFVHGQSEFDGKCLNSTDIDPFDWKEVSIISEIFIFSMVDFPMGSFPFIFPRIYSYIVPFQYTGTMWYEMYRSDKTHKVDCVHVMYEEMGDQYMVHYAGELDSEHTMWHDMAKVTGKSSYTLANSMYFFKKKNFNGRKCEKFVIFFRSSNCRCIQKRRICGRT